MMAAIAALPPPAVTRAAPGDEKVVADFEALFIAQLLRSAHAAHLADDPLAGTDTSFRDLRDQLLAGQLARAAPLGVAAMLRAR